MGGRTGGRASGRASAEAGKWASGPRGKARHTYYLSLEKRIWIGVVLVLRVLLAIGQSFQRRARLLSLNIQDGLAIEAADILNTHTEGESAEWGRERAEESEERVRESERAALGKAGHMDTWEISVASCVTHLHDKLIHVTEDVKDLNARRFERLKIGR